MINLFYLNPDVACGLSTTVVHLMRGFRSAGIPARLIRIGKRTEGHDRSFGWGEKYRNYSIADAAKLCRHAPSLVTAACKRQAEYCNTLMKAGAAVRVPGKGDLTHGWDYRLAWRRITSRKTLQGMVEDAVYLPRPYDRCFRDFEPPKPKWLAVSTCRVAAIKHPEILLDANRLLPTEDHIQIRGCEWTVYTFHVLHKKYPEYAVKDPNRPYPKELHYPCRELNHRAVFSCDMTIVAEDGGGTQNSTLVAADAGSCLVVHSKWLIPGDRLKLGWNCLAVSNGQELAELLRKYRTDKRFQAKVHYIRMNARQLVYEQDATKVAPLWRDAITH